MKAALNKTSLAALAVLAGLILPGLQKPVYAAEMVFSAEAASSPGCQFEQHSESLNKLKDNPPANYGKAVQAELKIRKDWMSAIISCSREEVYRLQKSLRELNLADEASVRARNQIIGQLDDVVRYYDAQSGQVADLGLQGSKNMARDLRSWREGNYLPIAERGSNLILWLKNQDLFRLARVRLDQINQTLRKLSLFNQEEVAQKYQEAESFLKRAEAENNFAYGLLVQSASPETSRVIKNSLDRLSETYQGFLDLSDLVKKFIPL